MLITKKVQRDRRTSGYVIAYIEPGGLVDKDGRFKVGDELINVNGQSLRGLSMEAARNVLRQLAGHVDIIVARQPQEATKLPNSGEFLLMHSVLVTSQPMYMPQRNIPTLLKWQKFPKLPESTKSTKSLKITNSTK